MVHLRALSFLRFFTHIIVALSFEILYKQQYDEKPLERKALSTLGGVHRICKRFFFRTPTFVKRFYFQTPTATHFGIPE